MDIYAKSDLVALFAEYFLDFFEEKYQKNPCVVNVEKYVHNLCKCYNFCLIYTKPRQVLLRCKVNKIYF